MRTLKLGTQNFSETLRRPEDTLPKSADEEQAVIWLNNIMFRVVGTLSAGLN